MARNDPVQFHDMQKALEANTVPGEKKPPNLLSVCFGITLCVALFTFTFVVIFMYLFCMLPTKAEKMCYFEQYRTIIENESDE